MKSCATFKQRCLAACIDNILSYTFLLIPVIFYQLNDKSLTFETGAISLLLVMAWPVFTLYNTVYRIGEYGSSIGKKITGLIVSDKRSFKQLGFWRAYLRQIAKKLSWFPLGAGYLWMLIDEHKQTWHDKISRAIVYTSHTTDAFSTVHKNEAPQAKACDSTKRNTDRPSSIPCSYGDNRSVHPRNLKGFGLRPRTYKKSPFFEKHLNFFATLSIIFMLLMLFLLLHICVKTVPLYKQGFKTANISLSQFTILALNISALIRKMRLFFIWASTLSLLILAIPKNRKLSLFLGITIGLVFLFLFLGIRFGIHHPHFMIL